MKRFIQTGIVLGIGFVLWQVSADARFLDLKEQKQSPIQEIVPTPAIPPNPTYKTKTEPGGISLQFEDLTLLDVLINVQDETGILFSIDPSLETVPFSARIQADNWEAAIRDLLKGFSRVEVWTDNLATSRVWLLSGGSNVKAARNIAFTSNRQTTRVSAPQPRKPRFRSAPAPGVSSQIKTEDLPPHILFEPGVLTYFKSKGIALPNKVKSMFGPNLEGLPANMPISPHILNDPTFKQFLDSKGVQVPKA